MGRAPRIVMSQLWAKIVYWKEKFNQRCCLEKLIIALLKAALGEYLFELIFLHSQHREILSSQAVTLKLAEIYINTAVRFSMKCVDNIGADALIYSLSDIFAGQCFILQKYHGSQVTVLVYAKYFFTPQTLGDSKLTRCNQKSFKESK